MTYRVSELSDVSQSPPASTAAHHVAGPSTSGAGFRWPVLSQVYLDQVVSGAAADEFNRTALVSHDAVTGTLNQSPLLSGYPFHLRNLLRLGRHPRLGQRVLVGKALDKGHKGLLTLWCIDKP